MNYANQSRCGELTRDEITELRSGGIAVGEIARICGVARGTLYLALKAWGLTGKVGGDHRSDAFRARFCRSIGGGQ